MSAKARAIEAVVGGGIGGLLGAGAGGYTYTPKDPQEWADEHGKVYARSLTSQEKGERKQRMMRAALIGALGGGSASLGGSVLRRQAIDAAEEKALPEVESMYLDGLKKVVTDRRAAADRAKIPILKGSRLAQRREADAVKAERLLTEHQAKIRNLLIDAANERKGQPWGGYTSEVAGSGLNERLTHQGQLAKYFSDLQKKHNLPPLQDPFEANTGENFFKKLLEKEP